jgi:Leucine-rich repeat (LRR) protein
MFDLTEGTFGKRAIAGSAWSEEMTDYLLDNEIVELELNHAKGWKGTDLSFLAKLPHLKSLTIVDVAIPSVDPIHLLHELRSLEVMTYCKTAIRFSAFPRLEECSLEWRPKAFSLFDCLTLKKLFVNSYKGKDLTLFGNLVNLESLAILNSPVKNLQGLRALKNLRSLRLGNIRGLTSLEGIEDLVNLEELNIQGCRSIGAIDEIASLSRLRRLLLNDDGVIESLKPLDRLKFLEMIIFYESTNIVDGDLSPLLRQENLSRVSFQNRRHYSHRREEFGKAYFGT